MGRPNPNGNIPATPRAALPHSAPDPESELAGLLAQAVSGSQEAWRRIVSLYWRRVFALARSRLRDHGIAEEVTQSVFVTVATKLGQGEYAEQGKFEPWLFRVAVNRIRDQVRSMRRNATATDDDLLDARVGTPGAQPAQGASDAALSDLRRCVAQLGDSDRQVIELRHHAGMSFAAMAALLNEPLGTLLARHHRALRKLRGLMEGIESGSLEDRL
ncbi:MAG: sigma-70 family RNA polymerase sigma factor [Phycisphaerales bacterium]|nr:sigma-70 family RNA polymerase sigma factor [Phycisphaerales bacterium]